MKVQIRYQSLFQNHRCRFSQQTLTLFLAGALQVMFLASAEATVWQALSMAALKGTTSMADGDLAFVAGYYSPGDRGGGQFIFRTAETTAEDGGRFIGPDTGAGRWVRLLNGETANVKMWGARGDNVTSDTDAIQAAVNACQYGWATELLFTSGSYRLTNTIVFPSQLHLRGEGIGNATMIRMSGDHDLFRTANANRMLSGRTDLNWDHFLVFENLYLDGGASVSNAALVVCCPGEASAVRNLSIEGGGYGIRSLGVGAPGLRILHCTISDQAVAGVSIEGYLPNGTWAHSGGGAVSIIGLSGDHVRADSDATASLLLVDRCFPTISFHDFKAEGQWGGGLIHFKRGGTSGSVLGAIGSLNVYGGTYNCDGTPRVHCDLVVLSSEDKARTASVQINTVDLYGVRNLIRDEVTGRTVKTDTGIGTGDDQSTCRLPIQYEGFSGDPPRTRLVVGENARYDLFPTNTGWYRVMTQNIFKMGGRLVITSYMESTDLSVDAVPGQGRTAALITVNRASRDNGATAQPRVTEARAGSYFTPPNQENAFLDIHVTRLPIYQDECITVLQPLEGGALRGSGAVQLLAPTNAVTSLIPPGSTLNQCVTNALTR
jgi:hypothetical protein